MEIIAENIFKINYSDKKKTTTHRNNLISVNKSIVRKIKEKEQKKKYREI